MTWHHFPHVPEKDAHIIAIYKGCKDGNHFEMRVREAEALIPLEKWCYYDDYKESIERKIKGEKGWL